MKKYNMDKKQKKHKKKRLFPKAYFLFHTFYNNAIFAYIVKFNK